MLLLLDMLDHLDTTKGLLGYPFECALDASLNYQLDWAVFAFAKDDICRFKRLTVFSRFNLCHRISRRPDSKARLDTLKADWRFNSLGLDHYRH